MKTYTFRTIIESDENDTFHGYAPALPGCHTWGETLDATRKNLKEAMAVYIESLVEDGEPVPEDRGYETIESVTIPDAAASYA